MNKSTPASILDRILVYPQYLLPQHLLSRLIYHLARCRWKPLKNILIRTFIRVFNVDMSEAAEPDYRIYHHFNDFFTRRLKAGTRKIEPGDKYIVSPVDGSISQYGFIRSGDLIQAKHRHYTLNSLLAGDDDLAANFEDGAFVTLYLSPRDYHRIHAPVDGRLLRMVYVPGRLFAVNRRTTRVINGLFARNERIICLFETTCGPMALIMVGAINVGSMETTWAGEITPARDRSLRTWNYDNEPASVKLSKGDELGRFNMGSSVILLFGKERVQWLPELGAGDHVIMGQPLAGIINSKNN